MLKGKTVVLGVTGSIAAYKIANLASALVKLHADVHVIMTKNATNFINPITFETLTNNKCLVDTFDRNFQYNVEHVSLAKKADVFMVAPNSPGHSFRKAVQQGTGVPGLVAVEQDATGNCKNVALAFARAVGCTKAGVLETTFKEETETDLFGEQAILCGGISALVQAGFETLVEAGYQPESAYFECFHELKLIVDLMYVGGLEYMHYSISDTAEYGDYVSGPRVITEETKKEMKRILDDIQKGVFAKNWILENQAGRPSFNRMRAIVADHQIEQVGKELRDKMPWLQK
jgi:ketol-acid reductoisomerase